MDPSSVHTWTLRAPPPAAPPTDMSISIGLHVASYTALAGVSTVLSTNSPAQACARMLYTVHSGTVITRRCMDWIEDTRSNLWTIPRGTKFNALAGPPSIDCTSKDGGQITRMCKLSTVGGTSEE